MSETSNFELFNAPAASEQKETNQEAFNEEMRRTQKAMKDLKQEEDQAKQKDDSLAQIIVQFLHQSANSDLFILISRAVAQNIPSELIIAVLSLIDKRSYEEVKSFLLKQGKGEEVPTSGHSGDLGVIKEDQKKVIDHWVKNISKVAYKKPHRSLETLLIGHGENRGVSPVLTQLSTFILRRFLTYYKVDVEFSVLRDFNESFFVHLAKNLEMLISNQRQLES